MATRPEVESTQPPSGRLASPENVLSFWFGTPATNEDEMTRMRRWFRGGAPMDEEVARRFGPAVEAALRHDLDDWAATARGRLALVLLLDQMTRSLYRNDPRSYAGDAQAQSLSTEAFDRDMHRELDFPERMFLAMPMAHAEDVALQKRGAQLANELAADALPTYRVMTAIFVEQTAKYLGVIRRFGRFPHRNTILGRTSAPEEIEFLKSWAELQPPKSIRPAS